MISDASDLSDTITKYILTISMEKTVTSDMSDTSLCKPLPFVKNIIFGTYSIGFESPVQSSYYLLNNVLCIGYSKIWLLDKAIALVATASAHICIKFKRH
jgi:hypothetical protein